MTTVYPWRHYVDGQDHRAVCSTCRSEITRWRGPDITAPNAKHRRLIETHLAEHA